MMTKTTALTTMVVGAALVASCAPDPSRLNQPSPSSSPTPAATASATPSQAPQAVCQVRADKLTLEQQVVQLYMVAVSTKGLSDTTSAAIKDTGVGSVVLLEESTAGLKAIASLTDSIRRLGVTELPILVAVDQEGGAVQRLKGEGFPTMPPAAEQATMNASALSAAAKTWGDALKSAGVRYNLAPVGDVVPVAKLTTNEPIGRLKRGYGSDPATAAEKVGAFVGGMSEAGVATSVKHFPGLGEVTTNTDFGSATDQETGPDSPQWQPFKAAIAQGASSVMVSSAVYPKLDPDHKAMYSKKIITDILRGELGFDKVVISDDVGVAGAVKDVPVATRGTLFLKAGGDLVINADATTLKAMIDDTVAAAKADPAFSAQVARSAARVLELKAGVQLIDCG